MAPRRLRAFLVPVASLLVTVACAGPAPSGSPASTTPSVASQRASPAPSVAPSTATTRAIASSGSIAVLAGDGSLSLVDTAGRSVELSDTGAGVFGLPTWSPDGSRIAAVRSTGAETSIVVFDPADAPTGPAEPTVVFSSATIEPFYLFWTPDSQEVSFLATEADALSLRLAPADGSAPLDGSGPGTLVRSGNPFYYDWIGRDRLFAHIGVGTDAFLGEIGRDGDVAGAALETPGDFRSAVVSRDQTTVAFVRGAPGGPGEIVVAGRDGSNEHATSVYGPAAVLFDPTGMTLGAVGPTEPAADPTGFPLGPLRVIDAASGEVRTLIDGFVVSFWWSPDGKTIAALRVQPAIGTAAPSAAPTTEIRLMFVDVAGGALRSQPAIRLGQRFIEAVLAYFDQYALSHQIWAPDSSSILIPEVGLDGQTHVTVRFPDGEAPIELDGEIGFWSP
jgi:TolB protein